MHCWMLGNKYDEYINELVQERRNSIANAQELRLSCTNPSICMLKNIAPKILNWTSNWTLRSFQHKDTTLPV